MILRRQVSSSEGAAAVSVEIHARGICSARLAFEERTAAREFAAVMPSRQFLALADAAAAVAALMRAKGIPG